MISGTGEERIRYEVNRPPCSDPDDPDDPDDQKKCNKFEAAKSRCWDTGNICEGLNTEIMFQIPSYAMFPGGNNNPVTVSTECGFGNYKSSFDNVLEYMSDGVCFYYTQEALNEDDDNTCAIVPRDENRPVLDFALFTVCNTDNKRTLSSLSAVSKSIHRLDESTVLVYPTIAWGKPCGINFAAGSFYRYNFRSQMLNFVVLWDQGLVKGSGAGPLFLGHNDDACCPSKRVVPLARVRNPPHTSGTVAAHFSGNYIATIFSTANFGLSVSAVSSETCPVDFIDGNSTGSLSRGEAEACVDLMRLFSIEIDSNMWQTEMALLVDADGASVTEVKASSDPVTHLCDSGEGVLVENVQVPDIQNDQGGLQDCRIQRFVCQSGRHVALVPDPVQADAGVPHCFIFASPNGVQSLHRKRAVCALFKFQQSRRQLPFRISLGYRCPVYLLGCFLRSAGRAPVRGCHSGSSVCRRR